MSTPLDNAVAEIASLRDEIISLRKQRDRFKEALEKIAYMDYRGNRSMEMRLAWNALHPTPRRSE